MHSKLDDWYSDLTALSKEFVLYYHFSSPSASSPFLPNLFSTGIVHSHSVFKATIKETRLITFCDDEVCYTVVCLMIK